MRSNNYIVRCIIALWFKTDSYVALDIERTAEMLIFQV